MFHINLYCVILYSSYAGKVTQTDEGKSCAGDAILCFDLHYARLEEVGLVKNAHQS